jgi:hypothetical protein
LQEPSKVFQAWVAKSRTHRRVEKLDNPFSVAHGLAVQELGSVKKENHTMSMIS